MRQSFFGLILLFFSCANKQKPVLQIANTLDSAVAIQKSNYDSIFTTEHAYNKLSDEFNIKVIFKRFNHVDEFHDSCIVKLILTAKSGRISLDTILLTSTSYFRNFFQDTANVLSYTKKVNTDRQIADNYFGDIVVADLNFDNKDDVAVINDSGGNGGSFYSYFLQTDNRKFILNKFLTDTMVYFPQKINNKIQTLTTDVHAGACCVGEHVYCFDKLTKKWLEKSYKLLR